MYIIDRSNICTILFHFVDSVKTSPCQHAVMLDENTNNQYTLLMIKRFFDISVSLLGMLLFLMPFSIIILLVKLSSKGPAFFLQERVGRNGKIFKVIKFRSMYTDSEKLGTVTTSLDARITPIGRFLRNYKLDEMPQLWNVFTGRMSFVGPRPDVAGYADKLMGEERGMLELRPGITGPASIYFKNEEELLSAQSDPVDYNDKVVWPLKVKINDDYLMNHSLLMDIGYILITIIPSLDKRFGLIEAMKRRVGL